MLISISVGSSRYFYAERIDLFWEATQYGRVRSFFSGRRNWDYPPHPQASLPPPLPPFGSGGGHTRLRERGWGSSNSDEGTCTVVLCINKYFVTEAQAFLGRMIRFCVRPYPPPPAPPHLLSVGWTRDKQEDWERETICWRERGGGGRARSQIIWPQ